MSNQSEAIVTEDDRSVARSGTLVVLNSVDDWVGIPFGLAATYELIRTGPRRLFRKVRREGIFSTVTWVVVAVIAFIVFAPLREVLFQLQVMFAWMFVELWLLFLPLTLMFLGFTIAHRLVAACNRASKKHLQRLTRASVRFALLGGVYYLSLQYGDTVRAFLEQQTS